MRPYDRPPNPRQQSRLPAVHEAWLPREHSLHRPRHARRQTVALVCAVVFFTTPLIAFTLGARPTEFENRALAPFPSLGDGWAFFTDLASWATDHLVLREEAIHAADAVSRTLFGEPAPFGANRQGGVPIQSGPSQPTEVQYPTAIEGKDGWLYLGEEIASHCEQVQSLTETVTQLRKFRAGVEATGRKFVVVVAPDKATVVPEHLPDRYVGKECHQRMVDEFWRLMAGEDYVIDLRDGLRAWGQQLGEPVYGPQDAHWSDEGGVLMARTVAEYLRPGISETWRITPGPSWSVPADIPPLLGRSGKTVGRDYAIAPDGETDQTWEPPTEYRTPLKLNTASGPGTYGLSVGLLGDSFTIRALPYLAATFGNMTVLHHGTAADDGGAAVADMLADKDVVVVEIAERSLVRGGTALINDPALSNILDKLSG
ncbi:alginate O-acetyltransferase AlgX-related protein [Saccharomonospora glauca]|jgi:alginate O-acetyltransferase complex protein AlgJ|uniref:AlgX/AlgJ SGNH hydrolase-like domain-containing protein n=1 Tax=Saccharomonospora glauca K62 TaxID=928724 RepID=I1CWM1_9PSEU|nr:hypothetical protein [Saccharomonospora glauca]EIE97095.1 hypothetical protein SacglDRAFT_00131 [Saccharomonospora glauca K62]